MKILLQLLCLLVMANPLVAAAITDSDRLFGYAEQSYPQYFTPAGAKTAPIDGYLARYYPGTDTYLGTLGNDVYVHGKAFGGLKKVGRIRDFIATRSDSDKLFNYAEQNYPQYFSPAGSETVAIDNYLARYYPGTDTYIGTLGYDVYVYGKAFGGLMKVGRITDFIALDTHIDSLSRSQAASGTEITVTGTGFTEESEVKIGDQYVQPRYVSETELLFIVPFGLNADQALIPLQPGQYTVQIDSGNTANLEVIDLPANPNPPGEVMNKMVVTLEQSLTQMRPEVEAAIDELRTLNAADPTALATIDELYSLLDLTNTALHQELPNVINKLDPVSLDTLERVLLNNGLDAAIVQVAENNSIKNDIQKIASMITWKTLNIISTGFLGKPAYASRLNPITDANQWLVQRKSSAALTVSKLLKLAEPVGKGCANPVVGTVFSLDCTVFSVISTASETFVKLALWADGEVGKFSIHGSQVNIGDQHSFTVSNIDNPNAYYSDPAIYITHNIDILLPIKTMVKLASSSFSILKLKDSQWSAVKSIWDKFVKAADGSKSLFTFSDEEGPFSIGVDKVEFNNCNINITDSLSKYLFIDINSEPTKALIKVLNAPASIPITTSFPIRCDIGVKSDYLTDEEKAVVDKSDYSLSWYSRLKVNKAGSGKGNVISSPTGVDKPESGITSGINCPSNCTEDYGYFYYNPSINDTNSVKTVELTATAELGHTFTGWSGSDAVSCPAPGANASEGKCSITMDGKEKNITATFGSIPPPAIVGTWHAQFFDGHPMPYTQYDSLGNPSTTFSYSVTLTADGFFSDTRIYSDPYKNSNSEAYGHGADGTIKYDYIYSESLQTQSISLIYLPDPTYTGYHDLILTWRTDHWEMDWDYGVGSWQMIHE